MIPFPQSVMDAARKEGQLLSLVTDEYLSRVLRAQLRALAADPQIIDRVANAINQESLCLHYANERSDMAEAAILALADAGPEANKNGSG